MVLVRLPYAICAPELLLLGLPPSGLQIRHRMKPIYVLTLLFMSLVCALAEQKSRKWYDDRLLLRMQGFLAGAALVIIWL